jgi:hypothetical protein
MGRGAGASAFRQTAPFESNVCKTFHDHARDWEPLIY